MCWSNVPTHCDRMSCTTCFSTILSSATSVKSNGHRRRHSMTYFCGLLLPLPVSSTARDECYECYDHPNLNFRLHIFSLAPYKKTTRLTFYRYKYLCWFLQPWILKYIIRIESFVGNQSGASVSYARQSGRYLLICKVYWNLPGYNDVSHVILVYV